MKKCSTFSQVSMFVLCIFTMQISHHVSAQCTANAGSDTTLCQTGSITLSGSFTASPSAPSIDIDQNQNNTCMANFSQGDLAQQFTATANTICGAGLTFSDVANGSLTISLYTNLPNAGGTQLATATANVSNSNVGDVYWPAVTITPGTFYYLVFTTGPASPISACVAGSTVNPYAGGMLYANAGFSPFTTFDYTFRTYTCVAGANLSWTGPNIISGANTVNPVVNPPAGIHTYTFTVVDPSTNCTQSDQVIVSRGQGTYSQQTVNSFGPYTWNGFTYTESGQYVQVLQSSLGCDSTVSTVLNIVFAGIDDAATNNTIIYPNPTENWFTLEFDSPSAYIEILDAQGKVLQIRQHISGETISLENEQSGIYFIRIISEHATTVHRVVKQ
jgi:hypothetical protein